MSESKQINPDDQLTDKEAVLLLLSWFLYLFSR